MDIKLCDIWSSDEGYRIQLDNAVLEVINKSSFIGGEYVKTFEDNFAKYLGIDHCVSLSSCTAALHLALEACEIKGKVLVPAMTVTADAEAIIHAGCTPVFYDNLDDIFVPPDTKAIIVVHLWGDPVDMNKVKEIAKQYNLFIIEDCAQSTGATFEGEMTGTIGDVGCFSFFPTKVLGGYGDGGALVTKSDIVADRVAALRNHGRLKGEKHKHHFVGYNYRLDGLKAAVLDVKLRYLDKAIEKRRSAADIYRRNLPSNVTIPVMNDGCVYYMYPIFAPKRNELHKFLKKHSIGTGLHYPIPVHKQPAFEEFAARLLPEADRIAEYEISLPMYPAIQGAQIERVCRKVKEFYA